MQFFDIHTHRARQSDDVLCIQSFSITDAGVDLPVDEPIAVGLHPWYASAEHLEEDLRKLTGVAAGANVKMIGECGLDKLRGAPLVFQIGLLERQVALAENLGKPLILHCVRAFSELIAIKVQMRVSVPMIIHGFNKHVELGRQLLDKGFLLSFGAAVLKPDSAAAKLVQLTDRFFLETDDANMDIEEIYSAVANLKKCCVEDIKARIFTDWEQINLKAP